MPPVKEPTTSRSERAGRTRRRMLDSARELFVAQGYAATSMGRIATDAGVAVQTLYYTFQTKGKLLCEVVEDFAAGPDPEPVARRPWMQEMLAADSGQQVLALAVEHGARIYERAAPLWPAVHSAAAADPHVQRYWANVSANRRAGQARMVTRLDELGVLRAGLNPQRATDLVVVLFGHDVFRGLQDAGWTLTDYRAWLHPTLVQQLLDDTNGTSGTSPRFGSTYRQAEEALCPPERNTEPVE